MSARSGFTPLQEAQIADQYNDGATLNDLRLGWCCSVERIRAALEATDTPLRTRGSMVGSNPREHSARFGSPARPTIVARKRETAFEDYLVRYRAETVVEPVRPPEPDCSICRQTCLAPLSHGRILRTRAQHERKKAA